MKILFITSNRLGDSILSTCVLNSILHLYPEATITLAGSDLSRPIFEDCPNCTTFLPFNKKRYKLHWLALWRHALTTVWDLTIDIRGSGLTYLIATKKRIVWQSTASPKHRVEQLFDLLAQHRIKPHDPKIWLSKARIKTAQHLLKNATTSSHLIAIAPMANWRGKEWPHKNWALLMQRLCEPGGLFPGAKFLLLCAPNERSRMSFLKEQFKDQIVDVNVDHILDIAALIKQATYFVGNDSGLMHLSAAVGTPTMGLFGPTRENHYHPWGDHCVFVRTPEDYDTLWACSSGKNEGQMMDSLKVETVYQAIQDHYNTI